MAELAWKTLENRGVREPAPATVGDMAATPRTPERRITWPRSAGLRVRVYTVAPDGTMLPGSMRDPRARPDRPLTRPVADCRCARCRPELHSGQEGIVTASPPPSRGSASTAG